MSDDFDRDDLDWLSDDGDDDESRRNDDDDLSLELDWLRDDDDDQPTTRDDSQLGVTGELSWRDAPSGNDAPSEGDDRRTGVTGQLSWLEDSMPDQDKKSRGVDEERTGVTGQLTWRGDSRESEFESQLEEAEAAANVDPSAFLDADAGGDDDFNVFAEDAEDSGAVDLPEWMQGMDMPGLDDDADYEDDEELYADDLPDDAPEWLSGTGALSEDTGTTSEPPSWLPDTGDLYEDVAEDTGEAPSWLSDTGSLGGMVDDADDAPEWLSDTGSLGGMVDDADDAPEWLSGSGTGPLEDDVPETQGAPAARADLPDWLAGQTFDSTDDDEVMDDEPEGQAVPDWLASGDTGSLGAPSRQPVESIGDEKAIPDWLQTDDAFSDESDEYEFVDDDEEVVAGMPDWLSSGGETEAAPMGMMDDPADDEEFESAVPDWLNAQQGGDDFDFGAEEEEPAPIGDVQEFESLFGEDDFALESEDDFDLLGELSGDAGAVDALLQNTDDDDDFDLLGELGVGESTGLTGMLNDIEDDEEEDIFAEFGMDEVDEDLATVFAKPEFPESDVTADDDFDDLFGMDDDEEEDAFTPSEAVPSGVMSEDDLDSLFGMDDEDAFTPDEAVPSGVMSEDDLDSLFGMDNEEEEDAFTPSEAVPASAMSDLDLDSLFGVDDDEDAFTPDEAMPSGVMSEADLDNLFDPDENAYADEGDERFDWFGEEEAPADEGEPSWLSEVEGADLDALPNDAAFLAELGIESETDAPEEQQFQNVDDYLSTFGNNRSLALPQTGDLSELSGNVDFDELFDEDIDRVQEEDDKLTTAAFDADSNPDRPAWLDDVTVNVGGVSASTMIRGQKDASIDELPDRLQALHERGQEMRSKRGEISPELKSLLPDATEVLTDVDFGVTKSVAVSPLHMSPEQRAQATLLQTLAGGSLSGGVGAVFADEDQPERAARRRRLSGRVLERFFILLILALAVILPFVDGLDFLNVGELPPPQFEAGSQQATFYSQVDSLNQGDLVLIAAEYGAPSAAELDTGLQALIIHLLSKGARPFIVSGNPVGLLHAGNVLEDIAEELPLVENQDYYVGRYLVGDAIGVRTFSQTFPSVVSSDSQGRPTGLEIESVDDFALIVVVSDRSDVIRNWAEQVAPQTTTPMLGISGYAASPLAQPYLQSANGERRLGVGDEIMGLLVGYRDAYTYLTMLGIPQEDAQSAVDVIEDTPTELPTEAPTLTFTPTDVPTATPSPEATDEALGVPVETTEEVTAEVESVVTSEPTATRVPPTATTAVTQVTSTPTTQPTATQTATPANTATPAVELIRFGTVNATTSINVRSGPTTTDSVAAVLRPRDRVLIIGENDDASWYQVLLEDGTPGWVAAFLLDVEVEMVPVTPSPTQSNGKRRVDGVPLRYQDDEATPELTDEVQPTATFTEVPPTETPTAEVTDEPAAVDAGDTGGTDDSNMLTLGFGNIEYRDERWYAMTLGLIAAILVIFTGTILNVLRALARRRRGE